MKVKVKDIRPGVNVSRPFGIGEVIALTESISTHGLLQPLIVSPDLTLIAGFRRYEAVLSLGWEEVEVSVHEGDVAVLNLIENLQRGDIGLWGEIHGIREAFGPNPKYADVRRALSKSLNWVKPRIDAWTLPQDFIDQIRLGAVDIKKLQTRLRRQKGPSVQARMLGFPTRNEITDAITRLVEQGRQAEATALSFAIGTISLERLLDSERSRAENNTADSDSTT